MAIYQKISFINSSKWFNIMAWSGEAGVDCSPWSQEPHSRSPAQPGRGRRRPGSGAAQSGNGDFVMAGHTTHAQQHTITHRKWSVRKVTTLQSLAGSAGWHAAAAPTQLCSWNSCWVRSAVFQILTSVRDIVVDSEHAFSGKTQEKLSGNCISLSQSMFSLLRSNKTKYQIKYLLVVKWQMFLW